MKKVIMILSIFSFCSFSPSKTFKETKAVYAVKDIAQIQAQLKYVYDYIDGSNLPNQDVRGLEKILLSVADTLSKGDTTAIK